MKRLPVSVQTFSHDSWRKLLDFYEACEEIEVELHFQEVSTLAEDEDEAPSV